MKELMNMNWLVWAFLWKSHTQNPCATLMLESHDFRWHVNIHCRRPYGILKDVKLFDRKQVDSLREGKVIAPRSFSMIFHMILISLCPQWECFCHHFKITNTPTWFLGTWANLTTFPKGIKADTPTFRKMRCAVIFRWTKIAIAGSHW